MSPGAAFYWKNRGVILPGHGDIVARDVEQRGDE